MKVYIITSSRKDPKTGEKIDYFSRTLKSVLEHFDEITVISQGKKLSNLPEGVDQIVTHFDPNKPVISLTRNNSVALRDAENSNEDALIFEDDVILSSKFDDLFEMFLSQGYDVGTMYHAGHMSEGFISMHIPGFYGTQCMYYSKDVVPKFRQITGRFMGPVDFAVKELCLRNELQLVCVVPNIVQHIGDVTSGCSGSEVQHYSQTFLP